MSFVVRIEHITDYQDHITQYILKRGIITTV